MGSYDKAITRFSPDGQLFQVQYAFEAVNRGSATISLTGKDCVILAVEKNQVEKLQDPRTIRKIQRVDQHLMVTFAGLQADARMLIDNLRFECQSFRYNYEDAPAIEYVAKYMAEVQQKATQKGGVRPFGISLFLTGFQENKPYLFQSEPSGALSQWKASAIGRKSKELREFLEKHYDEGLDQAQSIRLAVETLLEVVEAAKNIELVVIKPGNVTENVSESVIQAIIDEITAEKEAAEEARKGNRAQ